MTVVAADGQYVHPVTVDQLRVAVAETMDVIVEPTGQDAFTIFAQSMDRTGYARGTLAVREGLAADVPPLDPRALLTMADMGHDMSAMGGEHAGHQMPPMGGVQAHPETERGNPLVDMQTMSPASRLDDPGIGLRENGRRVLVMLLSALLFSTHAAAQASAPAQKRPADLPPVTDEMPRAAFPDVEDHTVHDRALRYFVLFDQLGGGKRPATRGA